MRSVTIKDIARLANVSHSTVSRTLNGAPGVSQATRERILALCQQHGYQVNLLARSLSASSSDVISCILPDLNNPLFAEMVLELELYSRQRGCRVMLCHGRAEDSDIHELFDFLIGHRVAGIILFSSSREALELVRRYIGRVPIVLQGILDGGGEVRVPMVSSDHHAGGRMAAEYFYSLGHRRVVYLGVRHNNVTHALRWRGFTGAAAELGLSVRTLANDALSSTVSVGYHLAKQVFLDGLPETGIFAACDSIALGVMSAAREFHLSIPEDFSLMGYDNINYAGYPRIHLTTLDSRKKELMRLTVDSLLDRIADPDRPVPGPRLLPPRLIQRSTCRRVSDRA